MRTDPGDDRVRAFNRVLVCALAAVLLSGGQGCNMDGQPDSVSEAQPDTPVPPPKDKRPDSLPDAQPDKQVPAPKVVKFGNVAAYPRERRIEVEAIFCTEEGVLEYLAVAESGKTYESVLQLDCEPSRLHAALLALGYEPGDVPQEAKGDMIGGESFGTGRQNPKSYLDIFVEWTEGERTVRVRAEELLLSIADDKPAEASHWVFTGSYFAKDPQQREWYAADLGRSIIAVWYDPSAVINLPLVTENPYRGPGGFAVNTEILPEGPKVKLIILPRKEPEGP